MNLLRTLPLRLPDSDAVRMVVETPAGSGIKYAWDEEHECMVWSRPLVGGLTFPYDFGFLPQTLGDDGDALDAMLLTDRGSHPGIVVPARILGALLVEQYREGQPPKRNDRIMLQPLYEHRSSHLRDVADLPARAREEIESFFTASLALTGKHVEFLGWADASEGRDLVEAAAQRFGS